MLIQHDLLTTLQAATLLNVDPQTVRRWRRAGKIAYVMTPGGHARYYRADLLNFRDNPKSPSITDGNQNGDPA